MYIKLWYFLKNLCPSKYKIIAFLLYIFVCFFKTCLYFLSFICTIILKIAVGIILIIIIDKFKKQIDYTRTLRFIPSFAITITRNISLEIAFLSLNSFSQAIMTFVLQPYSFPLSSKLIFLKSFIWTSDGQDFLAEYVTWAFIVISLLMPLPYLFIFIVKLVCFKFNI